MADVPEISSSGVGLLTGALERASGIHRDLPARHTAVKM